MSRNPLWRLSVLTCPEAEEAVFELLAVTTGASASSYTDVDTQMTWVSVYFDNRRLLTRATLTSLREELHGLRKLGLRIGPASVSLRKLPACSWTDSWKRHFKVLEIGSRLIIKPSWSRRRPGKNQSVVVLDPGLSFGTGQHPTTGFCLRYLVRFRRPSRAQSCLDIGTGSGILAISAAKLGYSPVDAFDIDPESLRVCTANARRNRVERRIGFSLQALEHLPPRSSRRYSVVCANLVADLLVGHCQQILDRLAPEGILLLAGILDTEFERIRHAYEQAGARLVKSHLQREWRSGVFSRREIG